MLPDIFYTIKIKFFRFFIIFYNLCMIYKTLYILGQAACNIDMKVWNFSEYV